MSSSLKILAQVSPTATTLSTLYTCATANGASISSIVICNTNSSSQTFRIAVAKAGEFDSIKQYLYYDLDISAKDTFVATIGLSLAQTDTIRIYASASNISFQLFGVEVS